MSILRSGYSDPDDLRYFFRIAVMDAIRQYNGGDRYRTIIAQDLRPLLNAADSAKFCGSYRGAILGLAVIGTMNMEPEEKTYVTKLCEFVQQRLRLTENGGPCAWAVHAVNADVCGLEGDLAWLRAKSQLLDEGEGSGNQATATRIQLEVVDDGEFSVEARLATTIGPPGFSGPHRFDKSREWLTYLPVEGYAGRRSAEPTGRRMTNADWTRLREVAISAVDSAIDSMRGVHEKQTEGYQNKYSSFKEGVRETYAPALVAWLWGRDESIPRGPFRNQIYHLIREIGIDRPITNRSASPKRQS